MNHHNTESPLHQTVKDFLLPLHCQCMTEPLGIAGGGRLFANGLGTKGKVVSLALCLQGNSPVPPPPAPPVPPHSGD